MDPSNSNFLTKVVYIQNYFVAVISVTIKQQHSELESAVELGTESRCNNRNDKTERMLVAWNGGGIHLD
jgi:hypothetical protein